MEDRGIYHQTFTHHWLACRDRIHQFEPQSEKSADDILTVSAQLDQMMQLLQLELGATNNNGETRILDTILSDSDNILAQVRPGSAPRVTFVDFLLLRLLAGPRVFPTLSATVFSASSSSSLSSWWAAG